MLSSEVLSRLAGPPLNKDSEELSNLSALELLQLLHHLFLFLAPGYRLNDSTSQEQVADRIKLFLSKLTTFRNSSEQWSGAVEAKELAQVVSWVVLESGLLDGATVYEVEAEFLRKKQQGYKDYSTLNIGKKIEKQVRQKIGSSEKADDILLLGSNKFVGRAAATATAIPLHLDQTQSTLHSLLQRYLPQLTKYIYQESSPVARSLPVNAAVQTMGWHQVKGLLAVVHKDDSLNIYNLDTKRWETVGVSHEFQTQVSCLAWRPLSGSTIAVACRHGVCLWEKGGSWMTYVRFPGSQPVTDMSWSPDGRFLALCSERSSSLVIWEASTKEKVVLPKSMVGVAYVEWSSNGKYLLTSSSSKRSFRIWETETWTSELWSDFEGTLEALAWSPDGKLLTLVTSHNDNITLYTMSFTSSPPQIGGQIYPITAQLGGQVAQTVTNGIGMEAVRGVKQLVWDKSGKRLAVCYDGAPAIAVFDVTREPNLQYSFRGCVFGPASSIPHSCAFMPSFKSGALLTTLFTRTDVPQTSISFVPMYFT